ncbi:MAG: amino acid decarboxylase [Acidimicrobiia bacterium]|nr:amino acid decarboxylase [Acidimicrobiia bacterium]
MDPAAFRRHGHELVDWIADYLEHPERYPVLSRNTPGDIVRALPPQAPEDPETFGAILADLERVLVPGLTHWNHPGFFAYFAITASAPGILAEFLTAALNQQAMLWRTSPATTELEEVALGWLRQLMGLPDTFEGVIYDTASVATLHALSAARESGIPGARTTGLAGRDLPRYRVYCSEQAHSSVDKAVIAIGLGHESLRRVPTDDVFRLVPAALTRAIAEDRAAGVVPLSVVATIGTTSTSSVDPLPAIADICQREGMWLHVDAAYGGAAALLPTHRHILEGVAHADSLVVNPHKWLFTPLDLSAFYCRRMDVLRAAFALMPDYLATPEAGHARNLMDSGIPLGRRFRALKLWMVMRTFGASGLRAHIARHIELAQTFAGWVDARSDFTRVAPVPFSVVCFRWEPARLLDGLTEAERRRASDTLNSTLLDAVNRSGEVFLSHTKLNDRFVIRLAIGHERTTLKHVARAWTLLQEEAERIAARSGSRS